MVIGYPGRTNRYISSFELREKFEILNPVISGVRRAKLDVWKKYMDASDETRLIYSDKYFGISNYTDYAKWENLCVDRFNVIEELEGREKVLQEWIMSDSKRAEKYGKMLENLREAYAVKADITKVREYFRESMVSGQGFVYLGNRTNSLRTAQERENVDTLKVGSSHHRTLLNNIERGYESSVLEVEKELMKYQLREFFANVSREYWGENLAMMFDRFNGSADAITEYVFANSILLNPEKFREAVKKDQPITLFVDDPLPLLTRSARITEFNQEENELMGGNDINSLEAQYTRAMYQMNMEKGRVQYPDANSTMRLTYGTVGPITPSDGIHYSAQSTTQGFFDKYNPDSYEFNIKPEVLALLKAGDWGKWGEKGKMYVNFLTNNDITGGNSGSPVLNAKGELIGLAFDGNKESLAGDAYFHPEMNKCVNVDIRYVLWIIEKYAKADHLIKEMQFSTK
jgi:hypothetical protein